MSESVFVCFSNTRSDLQESADPVSLSTTHCTTEHSTSKIDSGVHAKLYFAGYLHVISRCTHVIVQTSTRKYHNYWYHDIMGILE